MKPPKRSVRSCKLFFPALAAGLLLSLATGASFAAGPPDRTAPSATDDTTEAVPSATDNTTGGVPPAIDNATGAVPPAIDNATGAVPPAIDNATGAPPPSADNKWVDRAHSRVERHLFATALWFDRFFGSKRELITERPASFLRWMNDLRWDEEEHFSTRSTIRASLRLPRLKDRWHLTFSSESRNDPNAIIPPDPGNPALDIGSHGRVSSTELVYDILRTPNSILDVGGGVRVKIPPNAFVRTRFQHARPLVLGTLGRFTATAYWDARDGFGESNQLDLERRLAPPTLLRWTNSFTITDISRFWTWGTELSLLHRLSQTRAITFAAGASGDTHPSWVATNYRILARYRRNAWRKWLFLEGEPFIRWPKEEDGSRNTVWGGTLRVEILFAGTDLDLRDE